MAGPRLELTWPGKDQFLLVPKDDEGRPVWVDRSHPAAAEVRLTSVTAQVGEPSNNLLFVGDSLDMLRILYDVPEYSRQYRGRIKLVYIDPPFNTGQAFDHYDDWMEHSTWLSFMRERLLLIRELLAPEGSVWIHLDDAESHRMRLLMDEVLGAGNFISDLVVELNPKGRQLDAHFAGSTDHVLVYAKDSRKVDLKAASTDEVNLSDFPQRSDDGVPFRFLPLRNTNKKFNPETRPNLYYPLYGNPDTGEVRTEPFPGAQAVMPIFGDLSPAVWRWGKPKATLEAVELRARTVSGRNGTRLDIFQMDKFADGRTKKYKNLWLSEAIGSSDSAKAELKRLFPSLIPFATPKPERFMERVISIGSNPGDIVLDCFAGSGTTAAVAQKLHRSWVASEIIEETVAAFTLPRLEKVVSGTDDGGITAATGWTGGGGFTVLQVGPSMYEDTPYGVMLADWATNGAFARAVAGQLGFEWQPDAQPLCGVRGRMRLAVLDGAVGEEEVQLILAQLGEGERVTIVAKSVLPGAEDALTRGSRIRKAPRDLLTAGAKRMKRLETKDEIVEEKAEAEL